MPRHSVSSFDDTVTKEILIPNTRISVLLIFLILYPGWSERQLTEENMECRHHNPIKNRLIFVL
jgi:hypothetical protein